MTSPLRPFRPRGRTALLAGTLLLPLAIGCGGEGPRSALPLGKPDRAPNLLLITVDTLRADHLSAWGYARSTSPNLDRLASQGVRFEAAWAQWPKTGPSFASLFSSTYPKDNGIVRQIGIPLPCELRLLAEELQAAGYATHAVVSNGALGREFVFDQGFDTFLESWKLPPPGEGLDPNGAENVTRLALATAETLPRDRPWFLWVHYLDPHFPYVPPDAFRDRFQGDAHFDGQTKVPITHRYRQELAGIGKSQVIDGEDRLGFYVARYDAEIAYVDAEIGRLLGALETQERMAETITAFTSDHGESLGDHAFYFNHGRFAFETCLHVPLVLSWPGRLAPAVDREPVQLIDLAPTLLEAAGIELPEGRWAQGRSLWPRLGGTAEDQATLAFAEGGTALKRQWIKTVRSRRFKLHYTPLASDQAWIADPPAEFALFDLEADPGETQNVANLHPAELDRLKRALSVWWGADPFVWALDPRPCGGERAVDEETTRLLKSLGYL